MTVRTIRECNILHVTEGTWQKARAVKDSWLAWFQYDKPEGNTSVTVDGTEYTVANLEDLIELLNSIAKVGA